jgi:hypothetical protein
MAGVMNRPIHMLMLAALSLWVVVLSGNLNADPGKETDAERIAARA